jgi:hypothetical protein
MQGQAQLSLRQLREARRMPEGAFPDYPSDHPLHPVLRPLLLLLFAEEVGNDVPGYGRGCRPVPAGE